MILILLIRIVLLLVVIYRLLLILIVILVLLVVLLLRRIEILIVTLLILLIWILLKIHVLKVLLHIIHLVVWISVSLILLSVRISLYLFFVLLVQRLIFVVIRIVHLNYKYFKKYDCYFKIKIYLFKSIRLIFYRFVYQFLNFFNIFGTLNIIRFLKPKEIFFFETFEMQVINSIIVNFLYFFQHSIIFKQIKLKFRLIFALFKPLKQFFSLIVLFNSPVQI